MKCLFFLHAVLLWATARGDDSLLLNTDFPGNDIQKVLAPDAEYCQLLCTNHATCKFFTFIITHPQIASFTCFLKFTAIGIPPVRNPLPNAVSGFALTATDLSTANCFRKTFKDIDFFGSDIKVVATEDPTQCQEVCTKDRDCQFFTFVTENFTPAPEVRKLCFLKFATKPPSPTVINILSGVVSGYSQRGCSDDATCDGRCNDFRIPNIDFPGNDIDQVLTPDAEHCQVICSKHPQCKYFTFVTEDWTRDNRKFFCYLKSSESAVPVIKQLSNVVSGFSLRSFCLPKKCVFQAYNGLDFPGNDRKEIKVDSHTLCQDACTEELSCQMYTYVTENFPNAVQRKSCYLKTVLALPTPSIINNYKDVVSGFSLKECADDIIG